VVSFRKASSVVSESRSGNCVGYTLPGIAVWYAPEPGFVGSDRFDYDVFFTASELHETATVDVQAPGTSTSPSAAPSGAPAASSTAKPAAH
jgi:hypothetical protein